MGWGGLLQMAKTGSDLIDDQRKRDNLLEDEERKRTNAVSDARTLAEMKIEIEQKAAEKAREARAAAGRDGGAKVADARGEGLVASAKEAYKDNPEGLAAVDDAVKRGAYKQEVTDDDRLRGMIDAGYKDPEAMINIEEKRADNARADKRNAELAAQSERSYKLQEKQLQVSMANGDISRQEHKLKLDEIEKQNDPAARALLVQGAEQLANGDKAGAIKSFTVAGSHYGNKVALEQLIKLGVTEGQQEKVITERDAAGAVTGTKTERIVKSKGTQPGPGGQPLSGGTKGLTRDQLIAGAKARGYSDAEIAKQLKMNGL